MRRSRVQTVPEEAKIAISTRQKQIEDARNAPRERRQLPILLPLQTRLETLSSSAQRIGVVICT